MHDAVVLVVALGFGFVPGIALMTVLGVRRPLLLLALAPAVSVALAGAVGLVTAMFGLRFGAGALGGVTIALLLLRALVWVRARRHGEPAVPGWWRRRASFDAARSAAGAAMVVVGACYAMWSWLHGIGDLANPSQEHDVIIHNVLTAYIARSGRAAPWELAPVDVLTGHPVSFYPAGFHLLAAACSDITGDIVSSINAMTVVFLAIVLCTGVAALATVAARQIRLSSDSAMLAGGFASLVVAGLYRPAFDLMHDGGVLSNAAALALVPGVVAGVLLLPCSNWRSALAVGFATAGAVWVHPSAVMSVALTVLAWWAGRAMTKAGRRELRQQVVPLLVAVVSAAVLLLPVLLEAATAGGRTNSFPPDTAPESFRDAVGSTFGFPYGGYLDPAQSQSQVWVVLLLVAGLLSLVALRRGLGPVTAWAAWSLVILEAWISPGVGPDSLITGFFYNAMLRVWSHISLIAPVIAGVGVVIMANRLAVLARGRPPLGTRWLATILIVAAFCGYASMPGISYAARGEEAVAARYRTPDFVRVDADDQHAIQWLADHVRPGQRVVNSANDGSTYLYVQRGIPVVNIYTLGASGAPYTYDLLEHFNTYPVAPAVRSQLIDLNAAWVYVDERAPRIGSAGSPEDWAGSKGFSLAPGLSHLDGLPGLSRVYRSGSVSVYALDLAVLRSMDGSRG